MRLYSGTTQQFIQDAIQNEVADKIRNSYESYYGRRPNPAEFASWTNSLQFLKNAIESNNLKDNALILEYELPYSNKRIDCILFGQGDDGANVVVLELKQWSEVKDPGIDGNVITFVGGAERLQTHPSLQVEAYQYHVGDLLQTFEEEPTLNLSSCVYLHNYKKKSDDVLFSQNYQKLLQKVPLFTKSDFEDLGKYLKQKLAKGKGMEIFNRFADSKIGPTRKLLEHTKQMIHGESKFHLIDEQLVAKNTIVDRAKKCATLKRKSVIIVRGGPGTGKSVIALNALGELLAQETMVFHATGSSAFTKTLRKIVGVRAANLFKFFDSFMKSKENEIGVLICDEAHRIRKTSSSMYRGKSDLPQIDELLRVAKVCIFFIDDYQIVRPDEIGSTAMIKAAAAKYDAEVFDFELTTQFRCSGSDGYIAWVDDMLGIRDTANKFLSKKEKMEFKIFDNPHDLYKSIREKNTEKPNSSRLVAGFCWPWSAPNKDGSLVNDVVIGDFKLPWEKKDEFWKWPTDPNCVNQVGTVYTSQGFEFDYIGIIFGNDLVYDPAQKAWVGKPEKSSDKTVVRRAKADFAKFVKNVYRVLLTRGMKGCYVYFVDKDTENFVRSRLAI